MKKNREDKLLSNYSKEYDLEYKTTIPNFIKELQFNGVKVEKIKILENVELEQQSINGEEYKVENFLKYFDIIEEMGREMLYQIMCEYNELPIGLIMENNSSIVTLLTPSQDIELDEIINQKKNDIKQATFKL